MKKLLSINTIILFFISLFPTNHVWAVSDTWYFVVTAYYSPLPNQDKYLTGNYESEKRLNWQWIAWASWKSVFSWMLAAPKSYSFGTKIYLEWLWIWSVEDRGWAIVPAWQRGYKHDRIDVWMWYWDEWLQRALYWWKRTVKGYVVNSNSEVTINYNNVSSPKWATSWLSSQNDVFNYSLWIWSDISRVKKLQQFFKDLSLYNWDIDWVYNKELTNIVYSFQVSNDILSSQYDLWAWYWWVKTRGLFKKMYLNWEFDDLESNKDLLFSLNNYSENKKEEIKEDKEEIEIKNIEETIIIEQEIKDNIELLEENDTSNNFEYKANEYIESIKTDMNLFDSFTDNISQVKQLQNIMFDMWYYEWDISWNYDDLISPIYNYQIDNWIVINESSPGAWYFWPKTRASIKNKYLSYLEDLKNTKLEELKLAYEKEQRELEEQKRREELEQKYKELEKYALDIASKKIELIWNLRQWEVSNSVRELQLVLKDLWYFDYQDTAIFWQITREAVIDYQLDKNIISSKDDIASWIVWPKTLDSIKNDIKLLVLQEKIETEHTYLKEVASIDLSL